MARQGVPGARRGALAGAAVLLVLLGVLWLLGSRDSRPDLVLITIDTLRADHLASYGYFRETSPHIDRFARDALLFEFAVAPMATTLPAHASIMTGTYPLRHGVLSNLRFFKQPVETSEQLQTAAQMLAAAGYQTAAFTSSSPLSDESGIQAGFATFRGPPAWEADAGRTDWVAGETVDAALRWLEGAESPFFLWVHLFDPHDPYTPPEPFQRSFSSEPGLLHFLAARPFRRGQRGRAARTANRYDGEILYTDSEVGRLLEKLRELGLYDESVIVLAADHGEGLLQHNVRFHGGNWNEQLLVPLIFRFPGGPRGRVSSPASLIDILPTLAGQAGLPLDREQFQGIDLLSEERATALSQREVREQQAELLLTLTSLEWKYWYVEDGPDRLYHLAEDPYETSNVIDAHPGVAAAMKQEIERLVLESRRGPPLERVDEIPEARREQLRKLGYVE